MSSEDTDVEVSDELHNCVSNFKGVEVNILTLGEELKYIGRILSQVSNVFVVTGNGSKAYCPGTPVYNDNFELVGILADIFGPLKNPMYIVEPRRHVNLGDCIFVVRDMIKLDCIQYSDDCESEDGEISDA